MVARAVSHKDGAHTHAFMYIYIDVYVILNVYTYICIHMCTYIDAYIYMHM